MTSIVGPAIDNDDVEQAVIAQIQLWIDFYLAVKERAKGLPVPTIQRPLSYNATTDYQNWPEGQTPGVAVVCPGTTEAPLYYNAGVSAWFEVAVDCIVVDDTEALARRAAAMYCSAMTLLLTQQSQLSGASGAPFASGVRLVDWKVEAADEENRTLMVGSSTFHVRVDDLFDPSRGPSVLPSPVESDPGDYPQVATLSMQFQAGPDDQPLP